MTQKRIPIVAKVRWHLMFRVESEKRARDQLKQVGKRIGGEFEDAECKQYWKMPELWECDAYTTIRPAPSVNDSIVAALSQANSLGRSWLVQGPYFDERGGFESFSGIFSVTSGSTAIQSALQWAEVELLVEAAAPRRKT